MAGKKNKNMVEFTKVADNYWMGFLSRAARIRLKMYIMNFLLNKTLWRIVLIASLIFYLPGAGIFLPPGNGPVRKMIPAKAGNGIGGSAFAASDDYSRPYMLTFSSYTMERGDIIGHIAANAGLNEDTLISVNNIRNTRLMQIGQVIRVPNQDGIYYTVKAGDTLESIAARYNTTVSYITTVNELFSDAITADSSLFIPGARLDWVNRQEINGDLFIWPVTGRISSPYGWRRDPFGSGRREFHTGIDIAASHSAPVRAAMSGRVAHVGYNNVFGNFMLISHHSGYRTLYAHMHVVRVRAGASVSAGQRIGDVGSTGLSTGPHLHFTVYKDGVTVNPRTLMR